MEGEGGSCLCQEDEIPLQREKERERKDNAYGPTTRTRDDDSFQRRGGGGRGVVSLAFVSAENEEARGRAL